MRRIGRLCVITDDVIQSRFDPIALCELVVAGGADMVQFRDKRRGTRERIAIARAMRDICHRGGASLVINDRVDVAMAVAADGVHVGRDDLPVATARALLGPDAIIGATAPFVDEAIGAERDGASYIGFGHIYPTTSKEKPTPPLGPDAVSEIAHAVNIPIVAIGGIDPNNVLAVLEAGAWGVAVISAVCGAADPRHATAEIARIIAEFEDSKKS